MILLQAVLHNKDMLAEEKFAYAMGRAEALEAYLNTKSYINKEEVAAIMGIALEGKEGVEEDGIERINRTLEEAGF